MKRRVRPQRSGMVRLIGLLLVAAVASPALLLAFAQWDTNWNQLSAIGQAYGFATVLLNGVALLGPVRTLRHQARQPEISVYLAQRQILWEIAKAEMDDVRLLRTGRAAFENVDLARCTIHINQYFSFCL
ncbi:DUF6082 family protein [Kineosporia rhizophila]|uniref:DUF6082 family protein n=1 Tax=Kineosporia TaxID=49184 RepID=UPI001E5BACE0|nr:MULTISPECIES: DUF6082 family protein [Kineosporia]MCE0540304.1 DUF6082 family protein [Kineosporia rhizophila]GLY16329.1 hypothetical protein Kisp01_33440 [Kineosporia sp. NBRC 101677]